MFKGDFGNRQWRRDTGDTRCDAERGVLKNRRSCHWRQMGILLVFGFVVLILLNMFTRWNTYDHIEYRYLKKRHNSDEHSTRSLDGVNAVTRLGAFNSNTSDASHMEQDSGTDFDQNHQVQTCSLDFRSRIIRNFCAKTHKKKEHLLPGVLVGGQYHVLFCRICKAGVGSSGGYFGPLNGNPLYKHSVAVWSFGLNNYKFIVPPKLRNTVSKNFDPSQFNMIRNYPLDVALVRFQDYKKILLVRHPLQRVASAYYQRRQFMRPKNITFRQYVETKVLSLAHDDPHWMSYHASCSFCDLQYDYVLKLENVNTNIQEVNKHIGIDPGRLFPVGHVNPNTKNTGVYKYDSLFRQLENDHPDLFYKVLLKYKEDMNLFGYTWQNQQSGCHYKQGNCC